MMADIHSYLTAITGRERHGLLEVRFRTPGGMGRRFFPTGRIAQAARFISHSSRFTDVYVGVAPRARRAGGKNAIAHSRVVWAELDQPDARQRLAAFALPASMLIASGTPGHIHAYWRLTTPLTGPRTEQLNRGLAMALGADINCIDVSRILRPCGTANFKHRPPRPVTLLERALRAYGADELDAALAELATAQPPAPSQARARWHAKRGESIDARLREIPARDYVEALCGRTPDRGGKIACPFHELSVGRADAGGVLPARSVADASLLDDPLWLVPPPVYFERLTGLRVGPSGKLHCLFHDDRSPSLHVYREPGRGWYCFGCGRGGSVFDLASLLWGRGTRGPDFVELRRELERLLL